MTRHRRSGKILLLPALALVAILLSSCDRNCAGCAESSGSQTSAPNAAPTAAPNAAPTAIGQSVVVAEDGSVEIELSGTDSDGSVAGYEVVIEPENGTLSGTPPLLTYAPEQDFHGSDAFSFVVTDDAGAESAPAEVSIEVTSVNDAPVAHGQSVMVAAGESVAIVLEGSDVDGTVSAHEVVTGSEHGTLSGTAPDLTYTPDPGFSGEDAFSFTVTDDEGATSAAGEVTIDVAPPSCPDDRSVLETLYGQTDGDHWDSNGGWLTADDLAAWHGVTVEQGCVVRIWLEHNGLRGTIPWQLTNLPELRQLNLSGNALSGSIPGELGNLAKLESLSLGRSCSGDGCIDNQLTGPIPWELGNLERLRWLQLEYNALTGSLPKELGNLESLEFLKLGFNQFTGAVPAEFGNLANLVELNIQYNDLSGSIPGELGNLERLRRLTLQFNSLEGPIPATLGKLTGLDALELANNRLTGEIPDELGDLSQLQLLSISTNRLRGPIPAKLGGMTNLSYLQLHTNELNGQIPPDLGGLENLVMLDLGQNALTGNIPPELSGLSGIGFISLADNSLTGSIPPELGAMPLAPRNTTYFPGTATLDLAGNDLSGAVPPEIADLTEMEALSLGRNRLQGRLPAEMVNMTGLEELRFEDNDGLCAPADQEFQDWLGKLGLWRGPTCN